jgi:glycosyltransferase involved in cell wall biosynthesis
LCESGGIGGAETVVLRLVARLDQSRYRPTVVLMKSGWLNTQLREAGIEPLVLSSSRRLDLAFILRLRSLVAKFGIDVLHSHLPDANAYACLACVGTGTPVVVTYHGLLLRGEGLPRPARLKLSTVRRLATRVVAVSSALRTELIDRLHFSPDRTRVIHNGVDWTPFDRPYDRAALRRSLGLHPDDRVVGMVANLRPAKGYEYYVRAAARVLETVPSTRFLAIGETEPRLADRLQAEVARLGIGERMTFLGARDDVPALLGILDVFALSSLSEGMSIATVEAMGAGVPVVVTRSGGPEDIVDHGNTGLLVPPGDEEALAEGIRRLLANREEAGRLADAARTEVRGRFDIDRMVEQYAALYEEVAR